MSNPKEAQYSFMMPHPSSVTTLYSATHKRRPFLCSVKENEVYLGHKKRSKVLKVLNP